MNSRQELGGLVFFTSSEGGTIFLLRAAEIGLDAAIMLLFAHAVTHPAFG